jgi:hypothetical protein
LGWQVEYFQTTDQQTYLLDIGSMLIFTPQLKASLIIDPLVHKDLGRSWRSGDGSYDGPKPALLEDWARAIALGGAVGYSLICWFLCFLLGKGGRFLFDGVGICHNCRDVCIFSWTFLYDMSREQRVEIGGRWRITIKVWGVSGGGIMEGVLTA